ncbi:ubiquitin/ISG15-conjugating enzyme E2 L6 [Suncus etruscus]|uniref:ubiquitin/ISG15-conjugating enzyme E2 L6 n=1 Tax=Suncus etruscus TaxID=109475 RepID=UPI00210FCD18|nr:ubiquitin/ISG15-conjugating enzyme E2 L6 [Suncus etruscus]
MSAAKRVAKELEQLQEKLPPYLRDLTYSAANVLEWHVLLLPERHPYNLKAFKLCINFPREYPLMPPKVTFMTPIYHPDVDDNGQMCLPIISNENWKPYFHIDRVLDALNMLVNKPESGQSLHLAMAEELAQKPELFNKKAEEFTLRCGLERPP